MLTLDQAKGLLGSILDQFGAALTSPSVVEPGKPVTASIFPAVSQLNALEMLNGAVNAGEIQKNLGSSPGFVDVPTPTGPVATGGAPKEPDEIVGAVGGGGVNTVLQGAVTQLIALVNASIPRVDVKVSWWLRKPGESENMQDAVEGTDFIAVNGLSSPAVELLVVPPVVELTLDSVGATTNGLPSPNPTLPVERWCLFATVVVTLGTTSMKRDLGPIPLMVAPLPIPTVVALCNHTNLNVVGGKSELMFLAPAHSPISSLEELNEVLQAVYSVLDRLRMVGKLAGWLLGIGGLLRLTNKATYTAFYARDFIRHLDHTPLHSKHFWDTVDINDSIDSMLVVGPPGAIIDFVNEKDLESGEGILVLQIPATGFVLIPDMAPQRPLGGARETRPASLPRDPGDQILLGTSDGYEEDTDDDGFSNSITGIRFRIEAWPQTTLAKQATCAEPPNPRPVAVPELRRRADVALKATLTGELYVATVHNGGPDPASDVRLNVEGWGVSFASATTTQGSVSSTGTSVTADLGSIPSGSTASMEAAIRSSTTDWEISAHVEARESDPDVENNRDVMKVIG